MGAIHRGAVRGSVMALADNSVRALLGVLTTLIVAAFVGPDEFGVIAIAISVETLLIVLRNSGFSGALIQRNDLRDIHVNTVFWIGIFVSAVLIVGLILAAGPLASYYDKPALVWILRVLTLSIVAQAFSGVPEALLRKELQFGRLMFVNSGSAAIASFSAIVAAVLGAGVWALVLRIVVARVLVAVICWSVHPWRPRLQLDVRAARSLLSFGGYLFLAALMTFGKDRLDSPIIGKLIGLGAAGVFFMARNLALSIIQQAIGAIGQVMFAVFSAVQSDAATLRSGYLTGTRCLSVLIFPAIAGMIAISPEAVPIVLQGDWDGVIPIIQIISLQGIVLCTNAGISPLLLAGGRSGFLLVLSMFRMALAIGSVFLGCRWGVQGVAFAWTIAVFAWAPIEMWFACRLVGMSIVTVFLNVSRPLLASAIAAFAVRATAWAWSPEVGSTSLVLVSLEVAVGAGSYAILTAVLDRDTLKKLKKDLTRSFGS
jgi:PST family polysaccharide transporter